MTPPAPAPATGPAPRTRRRPRRGRRRAPPAGGVTPDGIPKLTRRRDYRVLGGVAGGIADHLQVRVLWVRVTFVLLALMAGAGVLAYALLWIFVPQASPDARRRSRPARSNAGRPWASPRSGWPS